MKAKIIFPFFFFVYTIAIFLSCKKDEDTSLNDRSKKKDSYWGYFKGSVNGKYVQLDNSERTDNLSMPIYSIRESFYAKQAWTGIDSINILNTGIGIDEKTQLYIRLYKLNVGVRYLGTYDFDPKAWYESNIKLTKAFPNGNIIYEANSRNPFKVEITNVTWLSYMDPIIDVKLEGILYNEKNPEDSIIIHARYGSR
ncbi:DUF5025 domain-containing protein [Bacteroides heparinolyticus]|uniref:DUF5025 domain-containing protein n=1 Tax=Prevotella heparinolytica TaxID=28113 RepID=UPI0035A0EA82